MNEKNGFPAWNNNPEIFEINRLPARTIFTGFSSAKAAFDALAVIPGTPFESARATEAHRTPRVPPYRCPRAWLPSDRFRSLNGQWQFSLAERPADRPADFFMPDFDATGWDSITVRDTGSSRGHDFPQYYEQTLPWEVREPLVPPFAPEKFNPVGSYRRTFSVPSSWEGMETIVSFQASKRRFTYGSTENRRLQRGQLYAGRVRYHAVPREGRKSPRGRSVPLVRRELARGSGFLATQRYFPRRVLVRAADCSYSGLPIESPARCRLPERPVRGRSRSKAGNHSDGCEDGGRQHCNEGFCRQG